MMTGFGIICTCPMWLTPGKTRETPFGVKYYTWLHLLILVPVYQLARNLHAKIDNIADTVLHRVH